MAQKSTIPKSTVPEGGFSDLKQIENWLNSLSEEQTFIFARIIASRAAQRVLPNISKVFEFESDKTKGRFDLTLSTLRCNAISRVIAVCPTREIDDDLRDAARSAANSTSASAAFSAGYPAALSARLSAHSAAVSASFSVGFSALSLADFPAISDAFSTDFGAAFSAISTAHVATFSASSTVDFAAVTADARALEAGATSDDMAARPLWPEESPYKPQFDRKTFLAAAPSFEVWLDWYEPIVDGKAPWGLPRDIANKLETRIALGDGRGEGGKDFWERDADEVNEEIKGWVEAARAEVVAGAKIEVPKTKPASVRAVWNSEVLENTYQLESDLAEPQFQALLAAFKAELSALIREASNNRHSNSVSADAILMLKATRKLIPMAYPDSTCLFRLAVKQEMMLEYALVVRNEWPNLLGSQYRALTVQLGMLLDQTPEV
jgi:hypothetical protein